MIILKARCDEKRGRATKGLAREENWEGAHEQVVGRRNPSFGGGMVMKMDSFKPGF